MDYDQHALDFLKSRGITMVTTLLRHGPYFPDDKESRDIYEVIFSRERATFKLTFGQSIAHSNPSKEELDKIRRKFHDDDYYKARNAEKKRKADVRAPTAYDVLACLNKCSPGTFEEWCADMGSDTDSRKAEATWRACVDEWFRVERFFTPEEITLLQEVS